MLKIKEWWNDFKQDLIFNISTTILSVISFALAILLFIIAFKEMINLC